MTSALSPSAYASQIGVNVHAVLNWIRSGELRALNLASRLGRRPRWKLTREAIEEFERKRTNAPAAPKAPRTPKASTTDYKRYFS